MKKSLDTEPAGKEIFLCGKSNLRYSILEGSRSSPTMDSAYRIECALVNLVIVLLLYV